MNLGRQFWPAKQKTDPRRLDISGRLEWAYGVSGIDLLDEVYVIVKVVGSW
jgi:hypothetical protein